MKMFTPIEVTAAMVTASSVAEPAASEIAWVSGGTYALYDKRIRTTTHREYKAKQAHTGRTALPEDDPDYWEDYGPTLKFAPFDTSVSTAATGTSPLTYTVNCGFVDSSTIYGLTGTTVQLVIKDAPGGTVIDTRTESLYAESLGLHEYLFGPKLQKTKVIFADLPLRPTAEATLTVTGAGTVGVGMWNLTHVSTLVGEWGGVVYGASVEPITSSRVKTDSETGRVTIKRGNTATSMRGTVVLPLAAANYVLANVQQSLGVPVTVLATDAAGYEGLNVFGLLSASMPYDNHDMVRLNFSQQGMF